MGLLIASFDKTKDIAKKVAKGLNAEYCEINVGKFPDSEFHLKLKKDPKNKTVVIMDSMVGDPNDEIIESILAAGIAKDFGAKKVILLATYFPYLRQDKHFAGFDSFSSKHIIKLFSEFDKILVLDPHLHRIKKMNQLSKKADNITTNKVVADYIRKKFKDNFEIIGPDGESEQWSAVIAKMLKKKVVILEKTRFDGRTIKQKEKNLGGAKSYILIDDIISTGKTLEGALEMAKKQGANKLVCIGIHGLLVEGADKRVIKHAQLITTNTIPSKYSKIDVSPAIIDALKKYK